MYGRQYPIWHDITACNYGSSKSYGSLETAATEVLVGSGKNHSHKLIEHTTTRRERHGWIVFTFGVDKYNGERWIGYEIVHRCWVDPDDMSRVFYEEPADYAHRQRQIFQVKS